MSTKVYIKKAELSCEDCDHKFVIEDVEVGKQYKCPNCPATYTVIEPAFWSITFKEGVH